jgi:hypothetical protein
MRAACESLYLIVSMFDGTGSGWALKGKGTFLLAVLNVLMLLPVPFLFCCVHACQILGSKYVRVHHCFQTCDLL